jgi:hypothetical protein
LRCIRFLIAPHRTSQRDSTTPRRIPAGVLQTVFLGRVRGKLCVKLLFQTVTRLWDRRAGAGGQTEGIVQETGGNVKRGVSRVVGQFPISGLTKHNSRQRQ